jgi:peptidoglycan/LPS O-acetylase OafA/YrhL
MRPHRRLRANQRRLHHLNVALWWEVVGTPDKPEAGYLSGINVLRGLLSLSVLLWHYQHFWIGPGDFDYTNQPWFAILGMPYTRGYDAVPIFWMVSGVVLANAYFTSLRHGRLRAYAWARVARLYPLHIITLIVVAILQLLGQQAQIYGNNNLKHFALNALFIPWWGFEDGYSFNAPIWSVSVEIPVYLAFALLIFKLRTTLRIWTAICALIAISILEIFGSELLGRIGIKTVFAECAMYFFAGVVISRLVRINSRLHATVWTSVSLFLLVILGANSGNWLFGTSLVLSVLAIAVGPVLPPLNSRPLRMFGELTYSVFLWHIPIQIGMRWILIETGLENEFFGSPLLLVAYVCVTYSIGYLSFNYVEEPLRRKIREHKVSVKQAASRAS